MASNLGTQLLRYRRLCGANVDCIREAQLGAIKVYRENGAPVELPTEVVQQQSTTIYSVDGFALGSNVFQSGVAYNEYSCKPSEQFLLFTTASVRRETAIPRGQFTSTYTLFYSQDGTIRLCEPALEPAWFSADEANDDIERLTKKYHQQPNLLQIPDNRDGLKGIIAAWGKLNYSAPVCRQKRSST